MKAILDSFLGDSKSELNESYQLEYPCPRCVDKYGNNEERKYNLSVNIMKQVFQCWKCSDEGDDEMRGSITKLIKLYGNETLLKEYRQAINALKESKLYQLQYGDDGSFDTKKSFGDDGVFLPRSFRTFRRNGKNPKSAISYLASRGITWDIIDKFNMGYSLRDEENPMASYRVFIPSYDKYGDINYWTGRDYLGRENTVKYYNLKAERKDIIFNEDKVQWDADITLVEGPFDHIVVPNSIPLLGKTISREYKLYWQIMNRANACVNVFLDADAYDSALSVYKQLNHDRLYGKIRYIPVSDDLDPSKIYELYGYKGIIKHLEGAVKINEAYLL